MGNAKYTEVQGMQKQVPVASYPIQPALPIRPLPPLSPCLLRCLPRRLPLPASSSPSCNSVNCSVPLQLVPRWRGYPSVKLNMLEYKYPWPRHVLIHSLNSLSHTVHILFFCLLVSLIIEHQYTSSVYQPIVVTNRSRSHQNSDNSVEEVIVAMEITRT